jgi:hypothetical protein
MLVADQFHRRVELPLLHWQRRLTGSGVR